MDYVLRFSGDISDEDRVALGRPGLTLYEHGYRVSRVWRGGDGPAEMTMFHMVRAPASSDQEARQRVVTALRRTPDGLGAAHSHSPARRRRSSAACQNPAQRAPRSTPPAMAATPYGGNARPQSRTSS